MITRFYVGLHSNDWFLPILRQVVEAWERVYQKISFAFTLLFNGQEMWKISFNIVRISMKTINAIVIDRGRL